MVDVAVLKSWDFSAWRAEYGGIQLPYRMDHLEEHGLRLRWTDALFAPAWQQSRPAGAVRRAEAVFAPFAQAALMARTIASAPITLAMFESEANTLAALRRAWPGRRSSRLAVVTCWLAHLLEGWPPWRRACYRWAYRGVDRTYYFSRNQGPILEEHLGGGGERLRYVAFGVDDETLRPTGEPDGGYVLAVGRDRGRDWTTLLAALAGAGLPAKVCCRPADLEGQPVPAGVEVLGYVPRAEYRRLLAGARVVAIASRPLAYPSGQSVLLEAMAMAKAAVVTATPALADYVDDGVTALAVPPGDPAALRERIVEAAGDDALRRRLGAGGRAAVEATFNARAMWATIAKDLLDLRG